MSPGRDLGRQDDDGTDTERYGDSPQRSIFSALWFRVLLAILILGVLVAVAVPYVLDFATSPTLKTSAKAGTPPPQASPSPAPTASPAESAGTSAAPAATPPTAGPAAPPPAPETSKPKPAPTAQPATKATKSAEASKAAPKAPAATKVAEAPKPPPATKVAEAPKPSAATKAAEAPKPSAATKVAEAPKAPAATKASSGKAAATGELYWVQVGAFKEPETAKRVVARLREQGFRAEESTIVRGASQPAAEPPSSGSSTDRYDVVVSGATAADVDSKLAAKGLTGENTPNGVVVRPSLPLREAVALSRDLADAGLTIQVRRVGGPAPAAPAAPAPPAPTTAGGVTLYRVRVGGFPDRAAAVTVAKQLEEKGFKPFIARGKE